MNIKKYAIVFSFLFFQNSFPYMSQEKKFAKGSTTNLIDSLGNYLKNSDLISPDLKNMCTCDAQKCKTLAIIFANIIVNASMRPDNKTLAEIQERLKNGKPKVEDFRLLLQEVSSYGEASLSKKGKLMVNPSEPTNSWGKLDFSFPATSYEHAHALIRELGSKAEWSDEKIEKETEYCFGKLAEFLIEQEKLKKEADLAKSK
jgi:hypothetical protein